ncbi:ferrichrome-iron receptor [Methyloceanibacter caenitepidi]|uniref:Ferrichrome-iron receptor n=1 Tax=Methyloceanibacter caenitepidi TaxID=1384459 RepID=A0A0A8K1B1_9HYPH|nr:ferrichrome-iron receptor [Methyloceanibacter caenitepidi]
MTGNGAPAATGGSPDPGADTQVPPVIVEQDPDIEAAPAVVEAEPDPEPRPRPRPAPRTTASAPVSAPAATADGGYASQDAIEEAIFDLPVDGSTLNRGSSGVDGYYAAGTSSATKTNTLIMNIPGSVSIIPEELAEDQAANTLGQALLYVPGIAVQQGEGHRDQLTFRGQETTADFFVDGVRDDIETFRDLYNVQTIEVLKGPNAMIFGRGGGGGVINRVTKRADGVPIYEGTVQVGSWGRARGTADVGQAISPNAAFRLNAMYEDSETFREFSWLERYGINPTMGFKLGERTTLHFSYEYKTHDQNIDRGGPSIDGRPFQAPLETYFGQPFASLTTFDGHVATATLEHETTGGLQIRNHTFFADYDKLYQNIFASSAVNAPGPGLVELDGYQNIEARQNFVNQTDFSYSFAHGQHLRHTLVGGLEFGVQKNDAFRNLPVFVAPGSGIFTLDVPVADPTVFTRTLYNRPNRRRFTDLDTSSAFIQDQFEITRYFELIGGIRFDRFDVSFEDTLNGFQTSRVDDEWSPRVGGVVKPWESLHFYASYAKSFLPANGDNFGELSVTASDLEPETFENYETGFKWTIMPRLLLQGAIYRLDRDNQAVTIGPDTFARGLTRTRGKEIEISGYVTDKWQVFGGYAHTDSEILFAGDDLSLVGNSVESVPVDTFSMWNKYQLTKKWGVGLGVIYQAGWFAEANNAVKVPSYTRFDSAVYYDINEHWSAQLNVENMFDTEYWISSHNNNNISYGAPTSAFVTMKAKW